MSRSLGFNLHLLLALAAISHGGCGFKTGIDTPPSIDDGDGGTRHMEDAGPPELRVECGRSEQYSSPRRPITLRAEVEGSVSIVDDGWLLLTRPIASTRGISPEVGPLTTLTPDVEGDFLLRYEVEDSLGRMADCEVIVHSVVGPPVALCPEEELRTSPGEALNIEGEGYDDEEVIGYEWTVSSAPGGSIALLAPTNAPTTQFTGFQPGFYEVELRVWDRDLADGTCVATVRVVTPPVVTCPDSPVLAPTRQVTELMATATDDTGIESVEWELLAAPAFSTSSLMPTNSTTTHLTPDRQGEYLLRFTAEDEDGDTASCEVTVMGTPTPPTAICPPTTPIRPLEPASLMGDAIDDGQIVQWSWRLVTAASGSNAGPPSPPNAQTTNFTPDIVGEYLLRLTVTDDDGESDSCDAIVEGIAYEGLRVELFWDAAQDMDLHLLHPDATHWSNGLDCYYANCNSSSGHVLDWFGPGVDDNPHLDLDDVSSYGPENINIEEPANGIYRVGVHAYSGTSNAANIRIYCGLSSSMPAAVFGPIVLPSGYIWRVADVEINAFGCTVSDLSFPSGAPNTEYFNSASEPR